MKSGQEYADKIAGQLQFFIDESASLPEEQIRWKPSDQEWSIMELLCHVEEFPLYFTGELENVLEHHAEKWGRNMQHQGRLDAVAAADDRQVEEVINGIHNTKKTTIDRLQNVKEHELNIEREHNIPKFGTKPMSFLVEHFLVEHLETHKNQFQRIITQYQNRQEH
ncbi:DinB family protein [Bacillus sp. FJAT-44742]|uniref:DinB family protein n=1 Tax=Bacillus sp. FJAT-44742 TaxID=2014005 RepID=UPI000C24C019|nr:DinB family protein [Bacillus sp. FJAT-44742]